MRRVILLMLTVAFMTATVYAEENNTDNTNFLVSSLTANDVDCKKCHNGTPHIIHAQKPEATCEGCHGDKKSVAIPQCTKCHNGPIHKVHAGKIANGCEYCHKDIAPVHTNLIGEAVCSHCHTDLIEVHGKDQSCARCHKIPPEIVKPLKAKGMILVCQNCHPAASVATIHGDVNNKQGCYNCHKGASKINGSDVPHTIHQDKASCKDCHEENGKVVVPQCTRCHKIDELHAFNKIGKLTAQSGLTCSTCHADISKPAKDTTNAKPVDTDKEDIVNTEETVKETQIIPKPQDKETDKETNKEEKGPLQTPGFSMIPTIAILYIVARKISR